MLAVQVHAAALVSGRREGLSAHDSPYGRFPQWLGKNSSHTKGKRLLGELHTHSTAAAYHAASNRCACALCPTTSAQSPLGRDTTTQLPEGSPVLTLCAHRWFEPRRSAMRLNYVPVLRSALTVPLLPTATNNAGKDGIAAVMELMDAYGLTRHDSTPSRPRLDHRHQREGATTLITSGGAVTVTAGAEYGRTAGGLTAGATAVTTGFASLAQQPHGSKHSVQGVSTQGS
jgi:hypothetical protein